MEPFFLFSDMEAFEKEQSTNFKSVFDKKNLIRIKVSL